MKIKVTQQGMDALNSSISKWREAGENIESDEWITLGTFDGCPLCLLYRKPLGECADCPLYKFTSKRDCHYLEFITWLDLNLDESTSIDVLLQATKDVLNVLERCRGNCVVIEESC